MSGNCGLSISQTLTSGLRRAVYRYSVLGEPLITHSDNILRATAMSQKNYFKLNKENSKDGLEHYFQFKLVKEPDYKNSWKFRYTYWSKYY